jgi:lysophospholipase L1-like esterase
MHTYLALGDSYTVGELVPLRYSFPYQTVQLLREAGLSFAAPEIVARTGWTTDELAVAISEYNFLPSYDFVSLLIGVNNQYRGRSATEYAAQFEELLKQALQFAGGQARRVAVLSIPDYGVTPAGQTMDPQKIARELDEFNRINRSISDQHGVAYIEITEGSREALHDPELVAGDKLHPSATEYSKWAEKLAGEWREWSIVNGE